jgi:hypothetical protein
MIHTYLAASLPELELGQSPPMSLKRFAAQCEGILSNDALNDVQRLVRGQAAGMRTEPGRRWQNLETQLRNASAARRRPREDLAQPFFEGYSVVVRDCVRRAFNTATPLERERILDRCRFALLSDIASDAPLGLERILSFAGQLHLVHRWFGWDEDTGRERFEDLVSTMAEDVLSRKQVR